MTTPSLVSCGSPSVRRSASWSSSPTSPHTQVASLVTLMSTGIVELVVELDVEVLEELELVDELELVLVDVLELLVLVVLELLVVVDVEVDVLVVPQPFVHESPSSALPSSHVSPEVTCTMPSPQMVHGLASSLERHSLPVAGQPVCEPAGSPQGLGLPSARIAG